MGRAYDALINAIVQAAGDRLSVARVPAAEAAQ